MGFKGFYFTAQLCVFSSFAIYTLYSVAELSNCCDRNSSRCGSLPVYLWHFFSIFFRSLMALRKIVYTQLEDNAKVKTHQLLPTFNSCTCIDWMTVCISNNGTCANCAQICGGPAYLPQIDASFFLLLRLEWVTHSPTALAFNVCVSACVFWNWTWDVWWLSIFCSPSSVAIPGRVATIQQPNPPGTRWFLVPCCSVMFQQWAFTLPPLLGCIAGYFLR